MSQAGNNGADPATREGWFFTRRAIEPDAFGALFTFQTATLVPAARFPRPGFASLLRSSRTEGGRSADPPPVHPQVSSGCPRLFQRPSFLLLRPPHGAPTILRVHRFEPG